MYNFFRFFIVLIVLFSMTIAGEQTPSKYSSTVSITIRVFTADDSSAVKNYAAVLSDSSGMRVDSLVAVDTNLVEFLSVPITGVHSSGESPTRYSLEQNYPNPFNPSSRIRFSVPQAGPVSLTTYTILGQEDASLAMTLEPGDYEVRYTPGGAAGVVFYRLSAGEFTETKKMVQFGGDKSGKSRLTPVSSSIQSLSQRSHEVADLQGNDFIVKLYNLSATVWPIVDTTFQVTGLMRDTTVTLYAKRAPGLGFVVGANGTILTVKSDRKTWLTMNSGTFADLHAIRFREPDSGYIVGAKGTILRTTDQGAHWNQQTSGVTVDLNSIFTTPAGAAGKYAWVCGDSGTILITTDNGASWTQPSGGTGTTHSLHSIDMYSEGGLAPMYTCGDSGTILHSIGAGFSWYNLDANPNYSYYSIGCYHDTAWVVGKNGAAFVTRSEGVEFAFESTNVSWTLRSLFVSKADLDPVPTFMAGEMWAVGDGGAITRTTNSGSPWRRIDPANIPTSNRLNSVVFVDSLRGWAFGDNGTIISTVNAGETWSLQKSGTTANLYGAYFYPKWELPSLPKR